MDSCDLERELDIPDGPGRSQKSLEIDVRIIWSHRQIHPSACLPLKLRCDSGAFSYIQRQSQILVSGSGDEYLMLTRRKHCQRTDEGHGLTVCIEHGG